MLMNKEELKNQGKPKLESEDKQNDNKEKFKDNQYEPKSKVKITPVDNLQELIKERSEERGEALANERTKIKEASESEETHAQ